MDEPTDTLSRMTALEAEHKVLLRITVDTNRRLTVLERKMKMSKAADIVTLKGALNGLAEEVLALQAAVKTLQSDAGSYRVRISNIEAQNVRQQSEIDHLVTKVFPPAAPPAVAFGAKADPLTS